MSESRGKQIILIIVTFLLKIQNRTNRETAKKNILLQTFWMIFIVCSVNSWMVMIHCLENKVGVEDFANAQGLVIF